MNIRLGIVVVNMVHELKLSTKLLPTMHVIIPRLRFVAEPRSRWNSYHHQQHLRSSTMMGGIFRPLLRTRTQSRSVYSVRVQRLSSASSTYSSSPASLLRDNSASTTVVSATKKEINLIGMGLSYQKMVSRAWRIKEPHPFVLCTKIGRAVTLIHCLFQEGLSRFSLQPSRPMLVEGKRRFYS